LGVLLFAGCEETGFIGLQESSGYGVGVEGCGEGVWGVEVVEEVCCCGGYGCGFWIVVDGVYVLLEFGDRCECLTLVLVVWGGGWGVTCRTEFMKQRFPELTRPGTRREGDEGPAVESGHPRDFNLSLRDRLLLSCTPLESPQNSFVDDVVV